MTSPTPITAFANQKGGVGKTTSVVHAGAALAETGAKVLLVDLDPQGSLTICCGVRPEQLTASVYNALLENGHGPDLSKVIRAVPALGCDLLPSTIELAKAELELISEFNREHCLAHVLAKVSDRYDAILIDCPPSLGLLTINALTAASGVIIPIQSDYLALKGANLLSETIEKVQRRLNARLRVLGVLVTMYDKRTVHAREVSDAIHARFGDLVIEQPVAYSVRVKDAVAAGESLFSYDPESSLTQTYRLVARRIRDGAR